MELFWLILRGVLFWVFWLVLRRKIIIRRKHASVDHGWILRGIHDIFDVHIGDGKLDQRWRGNAGISKRSFERCYRFHCLKDWYSIGRAYLIVSKGRKLKKTIAIRNQIKAKFRWWIREHNSD